MNEKLLNRFLSYSSILVSIRGVWLLRTRSKLLIPLQVLLFINIFYWPVDLILDTIFFKEWSKQAMITNMALLVWAAETIVLTIHYWNQRQRIRLFVRRLFLPLDVITAGNVTQHALWASMFGILSWLFRLILVSIRRKKHFIWRRNSLKDTCVTIIMILLEIPSFDLVFPSLIVYIIFFQLLWYYSNTILRRIQVYMRISVNPDFVKIHDMLEGVLKSISEFDNIFSLILLLSLTDIFASTAVMVVNISREVNYANITSLIKFVINIVWMLGVVLFIHRKQESLIKESQQVRKVILTQKPSCILSASFISQLDSFPSAKMTVWSLFPLDKSLILSFIASVMTFTVLFLQLSSTNIAAFKGSK